MGFPEQVKGCLLLSTTTRTDRGEYVHVWQCGCGSVFEGSRRVIRDRSKRGAGDAHCGCLTKARQSERNTGRIPGNKLDDAEASVRAVLRSSTSDYGTSLTADDVRGLIFSDCHYCGSAPSHMRPLGTGQWRRESSVASHGIDRKESSEGYHVHNCVPCCTTCNYMKRDIPYMTFLNHIKRMNSEGRWVGGNNV